MTSKRQKTSIVLPSEYGETIFKVFTKPVSLQAKRSKKEIVTEAIRKITKQVQNLLAGDISIEIIWFINEVERYESDEPADIDNILKPILDALSGPDGLLIDDCQVQHVVSSWIDRYDEIEHIEIKLNYLPDEWIPKEKTIFVQFEKALCMPLSMDMKPKEMKVLLDVVEKKFQARNRILERGGTYHQARSIMPIQRLFHRTRVGGFEVKHIEELREEIEAAEQKEV